MQWLYMQYVIVVPLYCLWSFFVYAVTLPFPLGTRARSAGYTVRTFCARRLADEDDKKMIECARDFLSDSRISIESSGDVTAPLVTRMNVPCLRSAMERLCPYHEATRGLQLLDDVVTRDSRFRAFHYGAKMCFGLSLAVFLYLLWHRICAGTHVSMEMMHK